MGFHRSCGLLVFVMAASGAAAQPPGALNGTVVDARTRGPIAGVLVQVDQGDKTAETDGAGRFRLDGLAPGSHALYVSIVGYILVKRDVVVRADRETAVTIALSEGTGTYVEDVQVTAAAPERATPLVPARRALGSADFQNLRGVLTDDPMRAVQTLPGVAANDDFRSEFSVRGSDFRHVGVVIDGVETHALMHAVRATQDGGSVAMINSDVLDSATLLAGSYPQRFGDHTGAELDFAFRSGSRDRAQTRASVSGTNTSAVMEGPLGRARKGSWILSARKSYLDLIINALFEHSEFDFGFIDAETKLAYDLATGQRVEAVIVAGRSHLQDNPATAGSTTIVDGVNDAGLASLAWIAAPSRAVTVTQRISADLSRFKNDNRTGLELDENDRSAYAYRLDLARTPSAGVVYEGGVQAERLVENARGRRPSGPGFTVRNAYDASADVLSAFGRVAHPIGRRWSFDAGARVDHTTATAHTAGSPWVNVRWQTAHGLAVRAGTGVYHQFPEFEQIAGTRGTRGLDAERATHLDLGVEQTFGSVMVDAVGFTRRERDFIRLPDAEPRLVAGRVRIESATSRYDNRLDGRASGFEVTVARHASRGPTGWIAYSFANTRMHDRATGESFRADVDQRHTFTAYGYQRVSRRLSIAGRLRAGSGTPIVGYFDRRGPDLYLGGERNTTTLPRYTRLDLRANDVFNWKRSRLTLFAEVINVFNRQNLRQSAFSLNRTTGQVTGLLDTMIPIVPSVGILIEF